MGSGLACKPWMPVLAGHRTEPVIGSGPSLSSSCYCSRWFFPMCDSRRLSISIRTVVYSDGSSTNHQSLYKRHALCAYGQKYGPGSDAGEPKQLLATVMGLLDAFYRFSRPHTVIGTVVGIVSVSLLPIESIADLSPVFFDGLFKTVLPAVFMNIYIVGLNQLSDVEIDKVNKPTLPLASGEFSRELGTAIVVAFGVMSILMGLRSRSIPLLCALLVSGVLGTAYSINLPLLRWKKQPFLAALCILCVRAVVVQLAFFIHMQRNVLGRQVAFTKPVIFATAFMCFFSAVIALFKDIPDVSGDRTFGIRSFSVRLGEERVFWVCIQLLLTAYGIAMVVGASSPNIYQKSVNVLGHALLASLLWFHAQSVDTRNKASITSSYMFIWNLFYTEYFLIPFMR